MARFENEYSCRRYRVPMVQISIGGKRMKRYLIFGGSHYYPSGGWRDLKHTTDSLDEARGFKVAFMQESLVWMHIVDTLTMEIIEEAE